MARPRPPLPGAVQAAALVVADEADMKTAARMYGVGVQAVARVLHKYVSHHRQTPGLEKVYGKLYALFLSSPYDYASAIEMSEALSLSERTVRRWLWWSDQAKEAMLFWERCRREKRREALLEEYRAACLEAGKALARSDPRNPFRRSKRRTMLYRYFPSWEHFRSEARLPLWMYLNQVSVEYVRSERRLTERLERIARLPRAYRPRKRGVPLVELAQRFLPPDHPLQPALARYQSDRNAYRIAFRRARAERRRAKEQERLRESGALDEPHAQGVGSADRGSGLGADAARPDPGQGPLVSPVPPGEGSVRAGVEGQAREDDRP